MSRRDEWCRKCKMRLAQYLDLCVHCAASAKPKQRALHDKGWGQAAHAQRRAKERFGVTLGPHRQLQLVMMIQKQQATFVCRLSDHRTAWLVDVDGQQMKVLYDSRRKVIVTVMPPEFVMNRRQPPKPTANDQRVGIRSAEEPGHGSSAV